MILQVCTAVFRKIILPGCCDSW